MRHPLTVNLGNFLLSISDALDLVSPQLNQHQLRVSFIAWEIGKAARLSDDMIETLFIASLLHDIGALSLDERLLLHRFEDMESHEHCLVGEALLQGISWTRSAAPVVKNHHRKWVEWDKPIDEDVVTQSQIVMLADHLDRLVDRSRFILHQYKDLTTQILSLAGDYLHPQIVDCFASLAKREEFWLDLVSPRLFSLILLHGPYRKLEIDLLNMLSISRLFKNIIDSRTRFTATHSSGVAACSQILSRIFGLTETEIQLMEIAGDLHDLGKLAVPNSILNKQGGLTKEEAEIMKSHTYFTYSVLSAISGFEQIAEWSAYHHERLDGSGYPFHRRGEEISTGARILMVADLFTALAENRPYRKGMERKEITEILSNFADKELHDRKIVRLVIENYQDIHGYMAEEQANALIFYEKQFQFMAPAGKPGECTGEL
jgi:HD-GYP domain-containing protein (c-di-GMP phosphodiesterase class II)